MSLINCPKVLPERKIDWYVFLAGPIIDAPKWQFEMPEIEKVTYLSPRRECYDGFDYDEQFNWETIGLSISDVVFFYIPKQDTYTENHEYARTTRTEFGEMLGKGKKMIVVIHPEFQGREYFKKKMNDYIFDNLEDGIAELKKYISEKSKSVYFTSDTHFSFQRALDLSKRPFNNINEMDWKMIENWNSVVSPDSTVFHLGDFGDTWPVKYLNGKIKLILGNYDKDKIQELIDSGIEIIGDSAIYENYFMTHLPTESKSFCMYNRSSSGERYFGLFGHIHGRQKLKEFGIDVGVDANNFYPINIKDVEFFKNSIIKGYLDDNVWC